MSFRWPKGRFHFLRWMVLFVTALSVGMAPAWAQSRPPPPTSRPPVVSPKPKPVSNKVVVDVLVCHATNSHDRVDPELKAVMPQVRLMSYAGFTKLSTSTVALGVGHESTVNVVGGRRLKVELIERTDRQAKLRFRLFKGDNKTMDTTVSIMRNRTFMVAGPRYDDGVLVLPLTVRY